MRALRALHREVWGGSAYDATYATTPPGSTGRRSRAFGFGAISFGMLFLLFGIAPTAANATKPNPEHKVTLCHATNSYSNPYVEINVDVASVLHNGHDGHDGPVFYPDIPKHTKWGDIIPPFDFGPGEVYAGKNWTADGIAILNNGCTVPSPRTTTTTTIAGETTTSTTVAGETTTTTSSPPPPPPVETSTTTTSSIPETESSSTTSTSISTVTTAGATTTVPGETSTTVSDSQAVLETTTTVASGNNGSLPFTGGNSFAAIIAGLVLIAAGFGLTRKMPLRP
jgi:hypothetical protein